MTGRWSRWVVAPMALFGTACSSWYRAGPQVRTIDSRVAVEGKGTIEGGVKELIFPLAVSAGAMTDDGEDVISIETGAEWATEFGDAPFAYVIGPRFVGMVTGPTGTSLGMSGGPILDLGDEAVLSLELFAGGGLSGEIQEGFVGGACLSLGTFHRGVFNLPHGRVLRDENGAVTANAVERDDWCDPIELLELPHDERSTEGHGWLAAALDEHASILAFERLEADLRALGAPAALQAEARRAARDEERHARLCFSIASAYLGRTYGPGSLPSAPAAAPSLDRLAHEAIVDGCFGEGLAAALAAERAARARDPAIRRALATIAEDEARHAELGWRTLEWCQTISDVSGAIERARAELDALGREPAHQSAFDRLRASVSDRMASRSIFRSFP